MTARDIQDVDRSLTGIKVSLATISEKMDGHVENAEKIQSELILAIKAIFALIVTITGGVIAVLYALMQRQ